MEGNGLVKLALILNLLQGAALHADDRSPPRFKAEYAFLIELCLGGLLSREHRAGEGQNFKFNESTL